MGRRAVQKSPAPPVAPSATRNSYAGRCWRCGARLSFTVNTRGELIEWCSPCVTYIRQIEHTLTARRS